jgi:hypothetical protein
MFLPVVRFILYFIIYWTYAYTRSLGAGFMNLVVVDFRKLAHTGNCVSPNIVNEILYLTKYHFALKKSSNNGIDGMYA